MPFTDEKNKLVAERVLRTLISEKYILKNYVFIEPFDINDTPGYMNIVGSHPLDLTTVLYNLSNNKNDYNDESIWIDINKIFTNAITYHTDRLETKWITQLARSMLKYVHKERKRAEQITFGTSSVVDNNDDNNNTSQQQLDTSIENDGGVGGVLDSTIENVAVDENGEVIVPVKKKKKKLKIKLSSSSSSSQQQPNDDNEQQEQQQQDYSENHDDTVQVVQLQEEQQLLDENGNIIVRKKKKKKKKQNPIDIDNNGDDATAAAAATDEIIMINDGDEDINLKKIKIKKRKSMESIEGNGDGDADIKKDDNDNDNNDETTGEPSRKKPKLKLKLNTGGKAQPQESSHDNDQQQVVVDENDIDTISSTTKVLKKKKKKDLSFATTTSTDEDDNKNNNDTAITSTDEGEIVDEQMKQNKPKIKFKLSLKKKSLSTSDVVAATTTTGGSSDNDDSTDISSSRKQSINDGIIIPGKKLKQFQSTATNSNNDNNNVDDTKEMTKKKKNKDKNEATTKVVVGINSNPGPRGKELPKAIADQQKDDAAGSSLPLSGGNTNTTTKKSKLKSKKSLSNKLKKSFSETTATTNIGVSSSTTGGGSSSSNTGPTTGTILPIQGVGGKKSSSILPLSSKQIPSDNNTTTTTTVPSSTTTLLSITSMNDIDYIIMKQCMKVLSGLRIRQQKNIKWFATPITDKKILPEYNAKIKYPMDMGTIQTNLEKGLYIGSRTNVLNFYLNIRRIFSNALQFNTLVKDILRPIAIELLITTDDLLKVFVSSIDKVGNNTNYICPPLLYCWKLCIDILNTIYKLENPTDGQPLALYFFHPVSYYCMGQEPPGYSDKVKKPMDFGTVTANLVEGRYQTVEAFAADCRLIITNCLTYYDERDDGKIYVDQANKLNECLSQQLDQLIRYDKSSKAAADRNKAKDPSVPFTKPSSSMLSAILSDLRAIKYTDKPTKMTQACTAPYEEPVVASLFPDYSLHVRERMDLTIIEKKIRTGSYEMLEDFDYDVNLLFKNYEAYNTAMNVPHAVAIAKFGARKFRLLLLGRLKSFEDAAVGTRGDDRRESVSDMTELIQSSSSATTQVQSGSSSSSPPGKKLKIESSSSSNADINSKKKKAGPKISIALANASADTAAADEISSSTPIVKSTKIGPSVKKFSLPLSTGNNSGMGGIGLGSGTLQKQKSSTTITIPNLKPNQPLPLHIAIQRVKEGFPIRRAVKTLQSWEADCARYFKELMRHPWISAARPKFIFHVPVPVLYPELRDTYASKIKHPMDLTTIECTLLSGNKYTGPEDFLQDVALVFTNAIRFNRDGRDIGDPLSCAYYDASVHLLKYARWLSFEIVTDYINESDRIDKNREDGLPPFSWTLTTANRKEARKELETLVLKEPIDISLEGDRWTWHEAECEKLLKALRHQSDVKYMGVFIATDYPLDYAAYISKPMDWEKVHRTLKKRRYHAFGDFIDDLRLIFTNALKYNAKHQGMENDSGRVYEAAVYMSQKLEAAINKMLLTVSDRSERERIDHSNAEREIEATERAEKAQIRASWKKPTTDDGQEQQQPEMTNKSSNLSLKIRNVRRVEQNADFEIPFFDEEDDGRHESSYFEVVKVQKALFERQRAELLNTRKLSKAIGAAVFGRHVQNQMAKLLEDAKRKQQQLLLLPAVSTKKGKDDTTATAMDIDISASHDQGEKVVSLPSSSSVLQELERADRGPVKLQLNVKKAIFKKRKFQSFDLDDDDE